MSKEQAAAVVTVRPQTQNPTAAVQPPQAQTTAPESDEGEEDLQDSVPSAEMFQRGPNVEEAKSAAIASPKAAPTKATKVIDQMKPVKVRPRRTIGRTNIGGTWYLFTANKECIVPFHVMKLLEEKGVI